LVAWTICAAVKDRQGFPEKHIVAREPRTLYAFGTERQSALKLPGEAKPTARRPQRADQRLIVVKSSGDGERRLGGRA
jgi:hypothetical protein